MRSGVIVCCIGNSISRSYWQGPPENVDHVDMGYLKDRYGIINTEAKAERFRELYKILFTKVSEKQLKEMKHALGLDYKARPYRNRFYSCLNDEWEDLIKNGLAKKSVSQEICEENHYFYYLTKVGAEYAYGKPISEKKYKEL